MEIRQNDARGFEHGIAAGLQPRLNLIHALGDGGQLCDDFSPGIDSRERNGGLMHFETDKGSEAESLFFPNTYLVRSVVGCNNLRVRCQRTLKHTWQCKHLHRPLNGFTLIELLVVVSIIALLVAILLPSLEDARRQAKVLVCATNLHNIGTGLAVYVEANNGRYPPPSSQSVAIIYTHEGVPTLSQWDNRQTLVDMVGGKAADSYFCPLWGAVRPPEGSPNQNDPFSEHFLTFFEHQRAWVGYNMFFLIRNTLLWFDWSQSGNPDGLPTPEIPFGNSSTILVSDMNSSLDSWDWEHPEYNGHNITTTSSYWLVPAGPFEESNALYGDGHVVTRRDACEYYVRRTGGSPWVYLPY